MREGGDFGHFTPTHNWGVIFLVTLIGWGLYIFIRGLYDGLRK